MASSDTCIHVHAGEQQSAINSTEMRGCLIVRNLEVCNATRSEIHELVVVACSMFAE